VTLVPLDRLPPATTVLVVETLLNLEYMSCRLRVVLFLMEEEEEGIEEKKRGCF
jgi:hypothetical protein